MLTIAFPGAGLQHKQLPRCLPNFPCLADGVRTLIVGRQQWLQARGVGFAGSC